jgi:hypothetical protein
MAWRKAIAERDEARNRLADASYVLGGERDRAERQRDKLAEENERLRKRGLDAQGAIQPVIGFIRLAQSKGEPIDEDNLRRLEEAHDAIKRIVDGEDYEARWAALSPQEDE